MPFVKGQSGNPKGRAPKGRTLTEQIVKQLNKTTLDADGNKLSGKRLLALMVTEAVLKGRVKFPDGSELTIGAKDWQDFVMSIYKQVDGPPRQDIDLTTDGKAIKAYIGFTPEDWDKTHEEQ